MPALEHLCNRIEERAKEAEHIVKTGRTHLMDAMPLTVAQEFRAWAAQIKQAAERFEQLLPQLRALPQGGTAIGTGINAHPQFRATFCKSLSDFTEISYTPAENPFSQIAAQDIAVATAGVNSSLASAMMKISNDLRWMNSGPLAGLGEISLKALQPGSSIMPGKVNPVIPEAVCMACAQAMGNQTTVNIAGQSGNFQLNVMLPVIAYNLLQSIELLTHSALALADQCFATLTINENKLSETVSRNPILVTALNPVIGYNKAAEIAKLGYQTERPVIDVAAELTDLSRAELEKLLDPKTLTKPQQES